MEEMIRMVQLVNDLDHVLRGFEFENHVGLSTFQREPKKWQSVFEKNGAIEVLDRNETYGVMLTPEVFKKIRAYINALEEQLEQTQLNLLFARRGENTKWLSGDELQQKTFENFDNRVDTIRVLLDDRQ